MDPATRIFLARLFATVGLLGLQITNLYSLPGVEELSTAQSDSVIRLEWSATFSSPIPGGLDKGIAVVSDELGNVYVAGKTEGPETARDFITIKYNIAGEKQWNVRYDGPAHGFDTPKAIAVDNNGSVYVIGSSMGTGTGFDFVTIKYNAHGVQQWAARYDGERHLDDDPVAVVIDHDGNVLVTGRSDNRIDLDLGADYDVVTIRYDQFGQQMWMQRKAEGNSTPNRIAIDGSGNVYIGATKTTIASFMEIPTSFSVLKYTLDGEETDILEFSGKPNSLNDIAGFAVMSNGNIFLAGTSGHIEGADQRFVRDSVLTVRYGSDGEIEWCSSFRVQNGVDDYNGYLNQVTDLTIDQDGNAYVLATILVTEQNQRRTSCLMKKYNSTGLEVWSRIIDAADLLSLRAFGLATDMNGNHFVLALHSGQPNPYLSSADSVVTAKLSPDGVLQWMNQQRATNAVDPLQNEDQPSIAAYNGNAYVVGAVSLDRRIAMSTVRYNASGVEVWNKIEQNSTYSYDVPIDMISDDHRNVYVVGRSKNSDGGYDVLTVKFDSKGERKWWNYYNAIGKSNESPIQSYLDGSGNICTIGKSDSGNTLFMIQYNSLGSLQQVIQYNSVSFPMFSSNKVIVDNRQNVYSIGTTTSSSEYAIIKWRSNGMVDWTIPFSANNNARSQPIAMAVDSTNNLYVVTRIISIPYTQPYQILQSFNPSGLEQWTRRLEDDSLHSAYTVFANQHGDVIVKNNKNLIKFDSLGKVEWQYGSSSSNLSKVILDEEGNFFIQKFKDSLLTKLDSRGIESWSAPVAGGIVDMTFDQEGNIYASVVERPVEAIKGMSSYSSSGVRRWHLWPSRIGMMRTDRSGNLYVVYSDRNASSTFIRLLKYDQGAENQSQEKPTTFSLSQNYPNPFNPTTTIVYRLPSQGSVELSVFDILGRKVSTLVNEVKQPGEYTAQWNAEGVASGVYFYRLQAGSFVDTKKMLLLR